MFSWLRNYDEKGMKIQICTLSFPSYNYLRNGVVHRRQKGKAMADGLTEEFLAGKITKSEAFEKRGEQMKELNDEFNLDEVHKHLDTNDIIVSNWDFVQENGDWKIEGIVMQRLR